MNLTNANRATGDGAARKECSRQEHHLNSQTESKPQEPLRAELFGANTCTAAEVTVVSGSPILALCRQLLASGLDVDRALEVYRKGVLALRVRSITEAAGLEVNARGTDFVPCAVRTGPPNSFYASATHPRPERLATEAKPS